jgi:uncharacterized protein YjiS (DUF1127 family)
MLQQLSNWLGVRAERRRTLLALERLDHRLLADIGVPGDKIEEFADPRLRPRAMEEGREEGDWRMHGGPRSSKSRPLAQHSYVGVRAGAIVEGC